MIEFWRAGGGGDSTFPEAAGTTEAEGWDGQMFMDSQCLTADPYARMAVWAVATNDQTVVRIDPADNAVRGGFPVSFVHAVQSIAYGDESLWVVQGPSTLLRLDPAMATP